MKLLLILGLIYFGVKVLTKLFMPWLLKTFVRKVERKMKDQMNQQGDGPGFEQKDEGVYIKKPQNKTTKSTKEFDGGEYIDFEEVDKE